MLNANQTQCNATAKSTGQQCNNPAVSGSTKCRLHGGKSLRGVESPSFKGGRYSKYAPATMQEKISELDDYPLLDLVDELQTQRALLSQHMARHPDGVPMSENTISTMMSWLNSIGAMVERIMKIRNDTALTGAEIAHLKARTAELVVRYIDDPEKRRAFVIELFQLNQPERIE